jgi:hypothetical protein
MKNNYGSSDSIKKRTVDKFSADKYSIGDLTLSN